MCSLVDLNRAFVWSNGENSRENLIALVVDLNLPFWTAIPATDWFMMVDLFPCKWLNFVRSMNWFSIPANIVCISIDEMNQYSYAHCLNCRLRTAISIWFHLIPFDFCKWFELLFQQNVVWFMIVDLFPCIVWIFCSIEELNHRVHCLNFERWTKCLKCWLELIFSFWTVIPVEIVCLST